MAIRNQRRVRMPRRPLQGLSRPRASAAKRLGLAALVMGCLTSHSLATATPAERPSTGETSLLGVVAIAAGPPRQAAEPVAASRPQTPVGLDDLIDRNAVAPSAPSAELSRVVRPVRPLGEVRADASLPRGLLPDEAAPPALPAPTGDPRLASAWGLTQYGWAPANLCHRPLYFEQVNLERYGYTVGPCLQPVLSGAHFFAVIPALPYKMAVDCPRECQYTLGYYPVGRRVPRRWHGLPLAPGPAVVEAASVIGLVLLFP